jgi:sugar phosphate permease
VGYAGFVFVVAGVPGLLLTGALLDATKAYRTALVSIVWTAAGCAGLLLAAAAPNQLLVLLCGSAALGCCLTAVQAAALEAAAEITYPTPPSTSSSVIVGASMSIYCVLPFAARGHAVRPVLAVLAALLVSGAALLSFCFHPVNRRAMGGQIGGQLAAVDHLSPSPRYSCKRLAKHTRSAEL